MLKLGKYLLLLKWKEIKKKKNMLQNITKQQPTPFSHIFIACYYVRNPLSNYNGESLYIRYYENASE